MIRMPLCGRCIYRGGGNPGSLGFNKGPYFVFWSPGGSRKRSGALVGIVVGGGSDSQAGLGANRSQVWPAIKGFLVWGMWLGAVTEGGIWEIGCPGSFFFIPFVIQLRVVAEVCTKPGFLRCTGLTIRAFV